MAVGIIIGGAFGTIVQSLVKDVIMPPFGMLLGGVDFSDIKIPLRAAGAGREAVTINIGVFLNNVISFLIVAARGLHAGQGDQRAPAALRKGEAEGAAGAATVRGVPQGNPRRPREEVKKGAITSRLFTAFLPGCAISYEWPAAPFSPRRSRRITHG